MSLLAIIGSGCVLPQSPNRQAFWQTLQTAQPTFRPIPYTRWSPIDAKWEKKSLPPGAYVQAKEIPQTPFFDPRHRHGERMAIAACHEALTGLNRSSLGRTRLVLACMSPGESYYQAHFASQSRLNRLESFTDLTTLPSLGEGQKDTPSAIAQSLLKHFCLGGGFVINAACASSLAAVDQAKRLIELDHCDTVIVGGLESNIMHGSHQTFIALGALAQQKCHPFDQSHDGVLLGEGAVFLVLSRLDRALAQGAKPQGVISAIGYSCDGEVSSLFSPDVTGQLAAYHSAYSQLNTRRVDYIEAHGTGTKTGDQVELESIHRFFADFTLLLGSAKFLFGHTRGASGCVGLLKLLAIIQHRTVPPSPYFSNFCAKGKAHLTINRKSIHFSTSHPPLRLACSSFGFGGVNYHLVLEEFSHKKHTTKTLPRSLKPLPQSVLCSIAHYSREPIDQQSFCRFFRTPVATYKRMDLDQKRSLLATAKAISQIGLGYHLWQKARTWTITALPTSLDIDLVNDYHLHMRQLSQVKTIDSATKNRLERILAHTHPLTEDTIPGGMAHLIGGHITQWLGLSLPNLQIDADNASEELGHYLADTLITSEGADIVILITRQIDATSKDKTLVSSRIFASHHFAITHSLPIKYRIETQLESTDHAV